MAKDEWKDSKGFPGVSSRRIEPNYYQIGRWVRGKIVEVDRLDRRNRGSEGKAGKTYRSERTGNEALWAQHLKRVQLMNPDALEGSASETTADT